MTKSQHTTWYLLVDGTQADPDDVSPDKDGVLRHKNGLAVALRDGGVPSTIGRSAVENKNVEAAAAPAIDPDGTPASEAAPPEPKEAAAPADRELKSAKKPAAAKKPKAGKYETR